MAGAAGNPALANVGSGVTFGDLSASLKPRDLLDVASHDPGHDRQLPDVPWHVEFRRT
jgi:hypothetical protein